ncbi:UDP-N-acetylmuramyl pentapeptide synthase [Melioribacter roseus P3M-2]|uniref:UDP-N-acetylmuramoyl-tripeptide--D-alanyl-D-alanine ligase n=1 Tax=Melioribacter roseus (strain DSM 23840 / JCM 17771 / VKM B-2668 / P3M-2) TaxID=1191523 RepID=I7A0S2_MELRP|nr:UDP-N-acetylmuramoyl-tripeptide--D-alanyl-D-alanine ligase [Melioribacter roseus]AFN73561.1 UDP-N-acetylmuramyl pentapeptide synthase [Melioribacter roseus P3M-2]
MSGKIKISLEDLFELNGAEIYNPDYYKPENAVSIDTRKIKGRCVYVAIQGEKFDGHDFIGEAVKKGADALVVNKRKLKKIFESKDFDTYRIAIIAVPDTVKALGEIAHIWRKKLNARIISITGSNGKTTTKDILASILSEKFVIVKTEANNNNHIGVPLTLLSADEKTEFVVLEHGTNHFGEIEYTANIAEPDFALITNIGDSHIEFLKSREMVFREKSALLNAADRKGGTVFINYDDPILKKYKENFRNVITYGFRNRPTVKGKITGYEEDGRTRLRISYKKTDREFVLSLYGEANAINFLSAAAVALNAGVGARELDKASKNLIAAKGRLNAIKLPGVFLIDDTYNSSPASVDAAYKLVKKIKGYKKKIFILGDIYELGKQSAKIHKELAEIFKPDKNLYVLTIGNYMKYAGNELKKKGIKTIHFKNREELSLYLKYEELKNSVILVKGSRGMAMEEFVKIIKERFE